FSHSILRTGARVKLKDAIAGYAERACAVRRRTSHCRGHLKIAAILRCTRQRWGTDAGSGAGSEHHRAVVLVLEGSAEKRGVDLRHDRHVIARSIALALFAVDRCVDH